MTAREYLSEVQRLQTVIEQKQERIKEIRESVSTVRAVRFDLEKVQGGGHTDKIGEAVVKIVDLEKEVENDIVNLVYRQHDITNQIHKVDNLNYMKILYKRYIEGKDFQTIANEIPLTYEYALNLHGKALKAFEAANKEILQKEGTYAGLLKVTEYQSVKDPVTHITRTEKVVVLENQPCSLSFESIAAAVQTGTVATVSQAVKLFLSPDIIIKPGSKIKVTQTGVTTEYKSSGVPAVYPTHQEIMLELFDSWA